MTDAPTTVVPSPLAYAHAYAALGWRVVPIPPGSKRPALPAWQDVATTDPQLIDQWWTRWPDHGIGLVMGEASGVFALDIDPRHGGDETLAELERLHGALPETVEAITGGGGRHLLFRWPPLEAGQRLGNSAGRLGLGLDIRGAGGQIVVAPSIHPDTGRRYEWEATHLPDQTPLAPAPDWLLGLLLEDDEPLPAGQVDRAIDQAYARDRYDAQGTTAAVELLTAHGWHSPRTDRDGTTYLTRPGKTAAEGSSCSIGRIPGVTYVWTDGAAPLTPGGYRNHQLLTALEHQGDAVAADRALVELVGGWRSVFTEAEGRQAVAELRKAAAATAVVGVVREAHAFLAEPEPEYNWLVPGLLERGDRLILTGAEGMGKSTLLRQIGTQIAAGRHPFTDNAIPPARVVLVDLENSARHLRRKIRGLLDTAGDDLDDQHLYVVPKAEGLDLSTPADVEWLHAVIAEARPDLLVIGPIYKMSNGDPTEETTAKPVAMVLDQIRAGFDCAIILEAHTPQATAGGKRPERPYGASLWLRWPEFGLFLAPDGALRHWRGARDEREWPSSLERGRGGDWPWVVRVGKDVTYMKMVDIQMSAAKEMSYRQIADVMRVQGHPSASKSTVARAIGANRAHWDSILQGLGISPQTGA